jgi:hypothetical protein
VPTKFHNDVRGRRLWLQERTAYDFDLPRCRAPSSQSHVAAVSPRQSRLDRSAGAASPGGYSRSRLCDRPRCVVAASVFGNVSHAFTPTALPYLTHCRILGRC